ncbi:MAG TPA: fimbria/pilus outer membrane usher protein [Polyangiales bacterium]
MLARGVAQAQQADEINPPPPTEVQAPFRLIVNHADKGEAVVVMKDDDLYMKRADLLEAGILPLAGRDVQVAGQTLLSLKSVSPPLSYELDEREIVLRITAPPELLPTTAIDLGGTPAGIVYRRDTAGFFNYAPRVTDAGRVSLYEEMGASIHGNLLFSSAYLSSQNAAVRGLTNFTIDDRQALRRTTLGDTLVLTGPLGSGHFVGGATIAREYDLDPYVSRSPHLGYVGTTMTPATLDVYVNGARVRSQPLEPGTFQLNNLRVGGGSGVATYVIRDVFGHEQTIVNPFYIASGVLAKGLSEYTYSVGALRDSVGRASWDYSRPAALGRHRVGLSDRVTLGGRAEATDEVISGGPAIDMLTAIGQLELEIGGSRSAQATSGLATFLSYSYVSRVIGGGLFGRFATNHYATVDIGSKADRPNLDSGVFLSVPIGVHWSLASQATLQSYRDRGRAARVGMQANVRIRSFLALLASASQAWNQDGTKPWEVFVSLSCALSGGHNVSLGGRLNEHGAGLLMAANKSLPLGQGYGYRASAVLAEQSSAEGLAQYQTLFGRYGADYRIDGNQRELTLDAAGALAVVPGVGVFPTLPVQDGFGVIRVAGVKNVRGYLNNQEIGRTDRNGNLLVPNLLSYYGNRLGIEQEDVPIQYGIQTTEMTLAPPFRGAAIADFPVTIPHFYRGRFVIDDHGKKIVPKYGQVRVQHNGSEVLSPLGEQGEFELDGVEPATYTAFIESTDGNCQLELKVADSEKVVVELGVVTCKVH